MKELYRNFEKLGVEKQWGYIVYDNGDNFLIEYVSVYEEEAKMLLPKRFLTDDEFSEEAIINQFWIMVSHGEIMDAQVFYDGKWYSGEDIWRIQQENGDYRWRRYVGNFDVV